MSHVSWTLRLWSFLIKEKSDRVWSTPYLFLREVLRSNNFIQGSFMLSAFLSRKKGILPYFVDVTRLQFWHFSASQHIIALMKTQPRLYCSTTDCWLSDAVCIKNRGCGKGMKAVKTASRNPFIPAGLQNYHLTGAISESAIDGVKQPLDQLVGSKKQLSWCLYAMFSKSSHHEKQHHHSQSCFYQP